MESKEPFEQKSYAGNHDIIGEKPLGDEIWNKEGNWARLNKNLVESNCHSCSSYIETLVGP